MLGRRLAFALLLLSSAPVRAQDVQFNVKPQFRPGERPAIELTPAAPVTHVHAALTHDGKPVAVDHGAIRAHERARLPLPGAGHYEGTVSVRFAGGSSTDDTVKFDVVVAGGAMTIGYVRDRLDLHAHTLAFTLSRPAASAELRVIGDDGRELARATADYHGERPGTWLPIHWTPTRPGNVLALELRAASRDGARAGVRLVPWSVRIPHEEVVFETGKADVRPSEAQKLDASYQKIIDAVAEVRKVEPQMPVKLYIAGHTDTVGSSADNRKLSLARARAIAAWFHDRGLPLPIAYAGFGEDALKVKTPDNTDEAANRRADYIVAVEEPLVARGVHAPWYKLQ